MKRRIIISLLLGIIICCIAVYSFATTGIVTNRRYSLTHIIESKEKDILEEMYTNLNVLEENNTEESIEKIINKGEKIYSVSDISSTIKVLENDETVKTIYNLNGWIYVKSDNIEGWVREENLRDINGETVKAYINSYSAKLRKQPTSNGEIISGLTINKQVEIIEKTNSWTEVKVNGNIGYVESSYISDTKIVVSVRSAESRRTTSSAVEIPANINGTVTGEQVAEYAKKYVGYRYVRGGNTPSGFDCCGFTQYVFKQFGYSIYRVQSDQAKNGVAVNKADLQPGDLICFSNSRGGTYIGHVGIYIGNGKFVHAANSRRGVIISNVDGDGFYYVCARRILA